MNNGRQISDLWLRIIPNRSPSYLVEVNEILMIDSFTWYEDRGNRERSVEQDASKRIGLNWIPAKKAPLFSSPQLGCLQVRSNCASNIEIVETSAVSWGEVEKQ